MVVGRGRLLRDDLGVIGRLVVLEETGGRVALGAGALDPAPDLEGLGVGELHVHVFLADAGQLAMELVGRLGLGHVELGSEEAGARLAAAVGAGLAAVAVKVVNEAEETLEVGLGDVVVVLRAEEGGHCVRWVCS